jgi:hypothetical protein
MDVIFMKGLGEEFFSIEWREILLSYEGRTWKYNIDEFTAVKKKKKNLNESANYLEGGPF